MIIYIQFNLSHPLHAFSSLEPERYLAHQVICRPTEFQTPVSSHYVKKHFWVNPFICFFFASSSLFFFPSTLALHHERLALYTTTLNDGARQLSPSHHFVHLRLTMTDNSLLHQCSLFS
jgi:hypothetical protein